jgi:hypothetical protein
VDLDRLKRAPLLIVKLHLYLKHLSCILDRGIQFMDPGLKVNVR